MKKIFSLLLAVIMIFSLTGCKSNNRYTSSSLPEGDETDTDFSSYVTPVNQTTVSQPTQAPVVTAAPTPTPTPTPVPTATPTPIPTAAVVNNGYVSITKSPTSETVNAGGSASFVAYGNNFTSINWIIANPDSSIIYDASNAPYYFSGLTVSGQGTSFLKLSNIPYELNGWKVQAVFNGTGGPLYTSLAYITVINVTGEESLAKDHAAACRTNIATAASSYGFTTTDITSYSFISGIGDFCITLTKGSWTVYAEFLSNYVDSSCQPLAITVYNGSSNVTESYPLTDQTMDSFYSVLSSLS